ncbi:hypothetical protein KY285_012620 [Solanum tuberosum]|nr:hypothetical protein KY285_012620 [Solanum tuberosum]
MTTAPVSHSNPKGKGNEKEKEKEKEKEEEENEKQEEEGEKEKEKEKEKVKKKAKEKERKKKKEKKVEVASCDVKQQYPFEGFNIDGEGSTELISSFSQWINEGLYKHHAKKRDKDEHYLANCSDLEFKQLDFVFAFPKKKDWFYVMSQPNKCWTDEKSKQQSHSKYRYTTTNYFFKTCIDNASVVPEYENKIVGTIKGFGIPAGLPWHLSDEVYVLVNCNGEFHWVLAIVVLKERRIKVYDSMSSSRTNRKLCTEIQKLSTMLPKYLESNGFYEQKNRTNWSVLESFQGKKKSHPFKVIHVTGIAQQASNSLYVSLLWNYGILKARSGYVSNNEDSQRRRPKKAKFDENAVIKVVVAIFSTTSVVICCDPPLQQGVVALIISSLSLISCQPNATGDSIMRSAMEKPFDTFRITLKQNDLNNNISLKWVNLSQDIEAFNNYPWGHESFELTVKYLLKPLGPKTNKLFGFPWALMAWAFEVIPYLTHQVNAEEEISSPRILRWLRSKTKTAKNIPDLYNPPHDAVVHSWLVPTEKELKIPYLTTLGLVKTLFDLVVDRIKMELVGARAIKRDKVVNELVVFDGGDGRGAGQEQGATSCRKCSGFLCDKCKKQDEDSIMYFQTLNQAVNEFKNKRGVKVIPSKNVRHPYTPHAKRSKKSFIKAIQNLKKKIFGELPMAVGEEVLRVQAYRILDLNFYFNFKVKYDKMSEEATTVDGRSITQLINEFEWDEDMINYVRGIRPYPGGMDWIGAKRLLAVMNLNKTHFVTLEILLHEGRMNVYDCLLMGMEHVKFLTFIQPVFELLPKLLKQSGIMKHLPDKFINEPWEFKDRSEPMLTNDSKATCASYSLAFIKHLITRTTIQPPQTLLCDNAIRRM